MHITQRLTGLGLLVGLCFATACDKIESQATQHDKQVQTEVLEKGRAALEDAQRLRQDYEMKQASYTRYAAEARALERVVAQRKESTNPDDARDVGRLEIAAKEASVKAAQFEAEAKAAQGKFAAKQAEAEKLLKQASGDKAVSALLASDAKAQDAQIEYEQGLLIARELDPMQIEARRLAWEIKELASKVAACSRQINALEKQDPATAGDAGAPAPLASVEKAKADFIAKRDKAAGLLADQDKKIEEKNKEIEGLKAEKAAADAQAVELLKKAESTRGQPGLNLFKQGQEARQKANEAALKAEKASTELADLQRDRARWALDVEQAKAAIDRLDKQNADLKQNGDALVKAKAECEAQKKALIGPSDGEGKETIVDLSKQLAGVVQKMETTREAAIKHLVAAGGKRETGRDIEGGLYEQAKADAQKASAEFSNMSLNVDNQGSPRIQVWRRIMETIQPQRFSLSRARVLVSQADLLSDEAVALATANDAMRSLEAVGVEKPSELAGLKDLSAVAAAAEATYRGAKELLAAFNIDDTTVRTADDLPFAARTTAMFIHYRLSQLMKLLGKADLAQTELSKATQYYNVVSGEIVQRGGNPVAYLPNLPEDLIQRKRSDASAFVTTPTTAPTTQEVATSQPTTGPTEATAGTGTINKIAVKLIYLSDKPFIEAIDIVVCKKENNEEVGRYENVGKEQNRAATAGDVAEVDLPAPLPASEVGNYYVKLVRKGGDSELQVNFEVMSGDGKYMLSPKSDETKASFTKDTNEIRRDLVEAKAQ